MGGRDGGSGVVSTHALKKVRFDWPNQRSGLQRVDGDNERFAIRLFLRHLEHCIDLPPRTGLRAPPV